MDFANLSCFFLHSRSVFFNLCAAGEPSANFCFAHGTLCKDLKVYIAATAQNCVGEFRSVSAEPLAATRAEPRLKNNAADYENTSISAIRSHCLPAWKITGLRQNAYYRNLKWTHEDSLSCYCYEVKSNSKTIWRKFRNLPLQTGKAADMGERQTHHCTTPGQWIWFLCTVGVIPTNKLSIQELNQFNRNEAPASGLLENFGC